jgi:hypothetical protein
LTNSSAEELFTKARASKKQKNYVNAKNECLEVLENDVLNGNISHWYNIACT